MSVLLLLAGAAIVWGAVLAALGRAGQMASFPADSPPFEEEVSAAGVALLRPPMALWGYSMPATEEALELIARSVTARDMEIASLRRQLADLGYAPKAPRRASPGTPTSGTPTDATATDGTATDGGDAGRAGESPGGWASFGTPASQAGRAPGTGQDGTGEGVSAGYGEGTGEGSARWELPAWPAGPEARSGE